MIFDFLTSPRKLCCHRPLPQGAWGLNLLTDAGFSQSGRSGLAGSQGGRWPLAITPDPTQTRTGNRLRRGWSLLRRGLLSPRYQPALVAMIKQAKNKNVSWVSEVCWRSFPLMLCSSYYLWCALSLCRTTGSHVTISASLLIRWTGLTDYEETIIVYSHRFLMLLWPVAIPKRGLEI